MNFMKLLQKICACNFTFSHFASKRWNTGDLGTLLKQGIYNISIPLLWAMIPEVEFGWFLLFKWLIN